MVRLILPMLLLTSAMVSANERPNFILMMGDDHGWDETGYNGHPHLQTPVLDEMAATGLRLDHFYAGHPTCSPTRASFLTGRNPVRSGTFTPGWSLRPEEISIAHLLNEAGYYTAHIGKWHVGPVKESSPTNPGAFGFDEWLSHDNFFELNPFLSRNGGPPQKYPGESSEILIDESIKFIEQAQKKDQPFLLVVWFGSPHEPYSGLEQDLALYENIPKNYDDITIRLTSNETGQQTERQLRGVLQERYAEITAMDRSIGTLRNWLTEAGLRDNTLLWYCGDNGSPTGASITTPFRGQKADMYEGGIRVPGLIEWPNRITENRVSNVNAVTSDILPTLCDIVGLDLPNRPLDGVSLQPLIDGQEMTRDKPICFWAFNTAREARNEPYITPKELQQGTTPLVKMLAGLYTRNFTNFVHPKISPHDYLGRRVILDGRYKLIVQENKQGQTISELFDLQTDPAETKNILKQNRRLVDHLATELHAWQESVLHSLTGGDYK